VQKEEEERKEEVKLTPNFSSEEFEVTSTGLPNALSEKHTLRIAALCTAILQPIRDRFGPVTITSGYRSPEVNAKVGGAKSSQHVSAEACDFHCPGQPTYDVWDYIVRMAGMDWPVDQAIWYKETTGHIHISHTTRKKNRRQLLLKKKDGSYVAWERHDDGDK
tara:strand:+ start:16361 stop:16849 length:489 start_codon:yes stop_codon:yes gene_type:complete